MGAAEPRADRALVTYVRKNGSHIAGEALVNFILPFAIYNYAEGPLGDVRALLSRPCPDPVEPGRICAPSPARRLSMLVVSGIALSLLAMLGGGGVRFLQLREKLVTAVIGLAFLGSAMIGKPLIFELARATRRASRNRRRSNLRRSRSTRAFAGQ